MENYFIQCYMAHIYKQFLTRRMLRSFIQVIAVWSKRALADINCNFKLIHAIVISLKKFCNTIGETENKNFNVFGKNNNA